MINLTDNIQYTQVQNEITMWRALHGKTNFIYGQAKNVLITKFYEKKTAQKITTRLATLLA